MGLEIKGIFEEKTEMFNQIFDRLKKSNPNWKKNHDQDLYLEQFCTDCNKKVGELHVTPTIPMQKPEVLEQVIEDSKLTKQCDDCKTKTKQAA